jgi:hypothetical protein
MRLDVDPIISFDTDEANALSLFPPENPTRTAAPTLVESDRSSQTIGISAPPLAASPASKRRVQAASAVRDFEEALTQAEQQVKRLEERTTYAFKRLQRAAQMEAVLEERLEYLEKDCASHTGHVRHRINRIATAGSRAVRPHFNGVVSRASAIATTWCGSAVSRTAAVATSFRESAVSRTTALARSYRQAAVSLAAARSTRRREIQARPRPRLSRNVIVIGAAVLALIYATAIRTVFRGGRAQPVLESTLSASRSAHESVAPVESAPALTSETIIRSANLVVDPPSESHVSQPVLTPVALSAPAAPAAARAERAVPPPATAAASPVPAPKVTAPDQSASGQGFTGTLEIITEPAGAKVFVDQQLVGESPVLMSALRAGSHVVRLEGDGYERWSRAIMVPSGKQTVVNARLEPE